MVKLFISQPMRGLTDIEIRDARESAIKNAMSILGDDVEVVDSFFAEVDMGKPLAYLGESLKLMSGADFVYFAPGWKNARGCLVERMCCALYGISALEAD